MTFLRASARIVSTRRVFVTLIALTTLVSISLSLRPEKPESFVARAMAAKQVSERIELLERAINSAHGNYPDAQMKLCLAYAQVKDWAYVQRGFQELKKQDCPQDGLMALAKECLDAAQWDLADDVLSRLPADASATEEGAMLFYTLYHATDRVDPMIAAAENLTRVAPTNARNWWLLAQIHEQLKNASASICAYEAALKYPLPKQDLQEMRHKLMEHRIEAGDAVAARQQLDAWRTEGETGSRLDFYDACIHQLDGQVAQALVALEKVLRELGEIPPAVRLRGVLHFELGHLKEAAADLKRVTELTADDEAAHFKLAEVYRRLGQTEGNHTYIQLASDSLKRYREIRDQRFAANLRNLQAIQNH